jgi:hypothetical protein
LETDAKFGYHKSIDYIALANIKLFFQFEADYFHGSILSIELHNY